MPARLPFTSWSSRGSLPELVRTMPARQLIYLWLAIFATFSMLGFTLDILTRGRQPAMLLALNVIFSGVFAVGYAIVSMPMRRWGYAAMMTGHLTYVFLIPRAFGMYSTAPPGRFTLDAVGIIVTVAIGYTCFLRFISVTATRYLRAQAEVFNEEREDLGFDWAKNVLQSSDDRPLAAIADQMLAEARAHGKQIDDQTLLLIRRRM